MSDPRDRRGIAALPYRLIALLFVVFASTGASAPAQPADAATSRFGFIRFAPPAGWQRLEQTNAVVMLPAGADLEHTDVLITLLGREDVPADHAAWFKSVVDGLLAGGTVLQGGDMRHDTSTEGYDVLWTEAVIRSPNGTTMTRALVSAKSGGRAAVILFAAGTVEIYQRHFPTFNGLLTSVTLVSPSAPPKIAAPMPPPAPPTVAPAAGPAAPLLTPGAGSDKLDGVYYGQYTRNTYNMMTHFYDYVVAHELYTFFADGRAYTGIPDGGPRGFDAARAAKPGKAGSYRIVGDKIEFAWADGQTASKRFKRGTTGIEIDGVALARVLGGDGLRLDGTWGTRSYVNVTTNASAGLGKAAPGVSGGVSGATDFTLSRDGRFTTSSFVGTTTATANVGAATTSAGRGAGSYRITEYVLELNYDDGRQERRSFFLHPDYAGQASPAWLGINGKVWLKR